MPSERRKEQNRINQRRYRMQIKNRIQMLENVIIDAQAAGHVQGKDHENLKNSSTSPSSDEHPETEIGNCNVPACDNVTFQDLDYHPSSDQILHLIDSDRADFMNQCDFEAWLSPNLSYFDGSDTFSELSGASSTQLPLSCQSEDPGATYCDSVMSQDRSAGTGIMPLENAVQETLHNIGNSRKLVFQSEPSPVTRTLSEEGPQQKRGSARQTEVIFDDLLNSEQGQNPRKRKKTSQKKSQNNKESVIATLRTENRRLKELSAALVNMYDSTKMSRTENESVAEPQVRHSSFEYAGDLSPGINTGETVADILGVCGPLDEEAFQNEQFSMHSAFESNFQLDHHTYLDDYSSTQGYFEDSAPDFTHAKTQTSHQPQATHSTSPTYLIGPLTDESYTFEKTVHPYLNTPSPFLQSLPSPSSYSRHEPTFSRRLLRRTFQIGYHIITHSHLFPPSLISRIYDFCITTHSIEQITEKLRICLGLGAGGEMVADQLRWGLLPDRRDVEGSGQWMEVADVEGWLKARGFNFDGKSEEGRWGLNGERLVPQLRLENPYVSPETSLKAPLVPYGTVWNPNARIENGELNTEDLLRACFNPLAISDNWIHSPPLQSCVNAVAGLDQGMNLANRTDACNYLDIDRFFECLVQHSVCLGRTAGFRIADVEEVLNDCLVKNPSC